MHAARGRCMIVCHAMAPGEVVGTTSTVHFVADRGCSACRLAVRVRALRSAAQQSHRMEIKGGRRALTLILLSLLVEFYRIVIVGSDITSGR